MVEKHYEKSIQNIFGSMQKISNARIIEDSKEFSVLYTKFYFTLHTLVHKMSIDFN